MITLLLVLQVLLVVTGGAVRVTGSGLGCPTWPECTEGSYKPVPGQAEGQLHAWIEFGNRLLTFALILAALAVVILVLRRKRRDLYALALGQVLGILGQGILGGITVLTQLNPIPVAGHLLLSMVLICGATSLHQYRKAPVPQMKTTGMTAHLSRAHLLVTALVLIVGTVVTGSGPHAGDADAPRFNFDARVVSWLHADLVIALLGISLALWVGSTGISRQRAGLFLIVALAQGAIGYIQYLLGLPELIVAFHLLGAALVMVFAWRLRLTFTRRLES